MGFKNSVDHILAQAGALPVVEQDVKVLHKSISEYRDRALTDPCPDLPCGDQDAWMEQRNDFEDQCNRLLESLALIGKMFK